MRFNSVPSILGASPPQKTLLETVILITINLINKPHARRLDLKPVSDLVLPHQFYTAVTPPI
jgi:hypothetical protein